MHIAAYRLDVQSQPRRDAFAPAPPTHCRRTSFVSTLVTSRYTMAALPTAKLAHEDPPMRCSTHSRRGDNFEKLPLRGGESSEKSSPERGGKLLRISGSAGSKGSENRQSGQHASARR